MPHISGCRQLDVSSADDARAGQLVVTGENRHDDGEGQRDSTGHVAI